MADTQNIRFNALRNALYHTSRRRFYERNSRNSFILMFIIPILCIFAMEHGVNIFGLITSLVAVLTFPLAIMQLMFGFDRRATIHQELQREYYSLMAEIEAELAPDSDKIARWNSRLLLMAADEPPVFRAIDAKAYNDAIDAIEIFGQDQRLVVPMFHKLFGGVLSFDEYNYRKIGEVV